MTEIDRLRSDFELEKERNNKMFERLLSVEKTLTRNKSRFTKVKARQDDRLKKLERETKNGQTSQNKKTLQKKRTQKNAKVQPSRQKKS